MSPLEFDLSRWVTDAVGGSMLLAIPVSLLAGLLSFFSPCVLPLLPGYLSYATGLAASDITSGTAKSSRGRALLGTSLFIAGFGLVFVSSGALLGGLGGLLMEHRRTISIVIGSISVLLGLVFAGVIPLGQSTVRLNRTPTVGVLAAPLLGIVFGIGWTPCIGPALSVVLSLAINEGTAVQGAVLAVAYTLGLGIPFLVAALAFNRFSATTNWLKKHHRGLQLLGGCMMVAVGVLLITGLWDKLMAIVVQWAAAFGTVI